VIERAAHRLRQGLHALTAFARPLDEAEAAAVLPLPLLGLFRRMRRSEQQHSLRVLRVLQAQGHTHPDLLAAALLHDVGKSRYPLTIFGRVMVVLARAAWPRQAAVWGAGEPRGWRRPFVIAQQHPIWSAEDVAAAGASPLVAALVRRHQEQLDAAARSEEDRLLALLQAADAASD